MSIVVGGRLARDGSDMDTLGKRIAHARKKLKGTSKRVPYMTAKELGALVGLEANTVSRWERDQGEAPTLDKIERFAEKLGVRVEWLTTGALPMYPDTERVDHAEADELPFVRDEMLEEVIGDWPEEAQRNARDVRRSLGDESTPDLLIANLRAIARRHRLPVELRLTTDESGLRIERADLGDEQRL